MVPTTSIQIQIPIIMVLGVVDVLTVIDAVMEAIAKVDAEAAVTETW